MTPPKSKLKREINRELVEHLKRQAKQYAKRRRKTSAPGHDSERLTYMQWLDKLCAEYGFTYTGLRQHVSDNEAAANKAANADLWRQRLTRPWRWGTLCENPGQAPRESLELPPSPDGTLPWPHCLVGSDLFNHTEGPRRMRCGPLFVLGTPARKDPADVAALGAIQQLFLLSEEAAEMFYEGEALGHATDGMLLKALIMIAGREPCGRLCRVKLDRLNAMLDGPLFRKGIAEDGGLERSLWRLTNCTLEVPAYGYDGPLLAYADATGFPDELVFRLPPDFIFLYSLLRLR